MWHKFKDGQLINFAYVEKVQKETVTSGGFSKQNYRVTLNMASKELVSKWFATENDMNKEYDVIMEVLIGKKVVKRKKSLR